MSHRILLFCDRPKSYSMAMKNDTVNKVENDRGHVKSEEKNALTNDTLNIVRSEILMLVNTATGSHMPII